jgi:uncharacterized membrane protein YccC
MPAAGLLEWLKSKDPGLVAIKRAARVTLAACVAFYFSLYVLDDTQMATFAAFGCIALGALSEVIGEPRERTKTYGAALLAGIGLVSLGTVLAVNTWAAVAGMLVVGFAIAYAGAGGPRVVGAANGLQLLYILPSFPPYAPESLGSRLIGLILGVGLLAIADRVLWPPPVPKPFSHRLAEAVRAVHDRLLAVLNSDSDRQPQAQPRSAISLRLSSIPAPERPTGPGRRDRATMHAVTILRGLEARVAALAGLTLTRQSRATAVHQEGRKLLGVSAHSLGESAEALDSPPDGDAQTDSASVEAALAGYVQWREAVIGSAEVDQDLPNRLRFAVVVEELAVWTRDLAVATRIMHGDRVPEPPTRSIAEPFWYSARSTPSLWFRRFRGHFTPRSVFFQNAVRLAVGLAAARLVAGLLDLSHGFWMLLATLTLMRTSVATTRATVVPAFLGTVAGGLVAALVLALAGADSAVYEVAFPFVMFFALAAGPIAGLAAGQALFTLLVALLFAQMAPVSWRLAEVRVLDVVLGGLLGAVVGLLVWPRGATGEMRRTAKTTLDAAANDLESSVQSLTHQVASVGRRDSAEVAVHFLTLADSTYAQYRSELRSSPDAVDWMGVLSLVHEVVRGGQALRRTHDTAGPLPWPGVTAELEHLGAGTADRLRRIGGLVSTKPSTPHTAATTTDASEESWILTTGARVMAGRQTHPAAAVRVLDIWGWLAGVSFDSRRVTDSVAGAIDSR